MKKQILERGVSSVKLIAGVFLLGVLIIGGAIMYGKSDNGQIDVSATISNANTTSVNAGESSDNQVQQPVSRELSNLPNGGLVGTGKNEPTPPPPTEQASTTNTATTTESAGTTTPEQNN